jgi:hypothetical protein
MGTTEDLARSRYSSSPRSKCRWRSASRMGGLFANNGTMVKSTHPGNAARLSTEAALLARRGFLSHDAIFEAPRGYVAVLFDDHFDCAKRVLPPADIDRVRDMVENLERLTDIRQLIALLAPRDCVGGGAPV